MPDLNPNLGPDPTRAIYARAHRSRPMSPHDLQTVFREAAKWELSNGSLSQRRRKRLVQYAAALQISAVDAGRLIQEAAAELERDLALQAAVPPDLRLARDDSFNGLRCPTWLKLSLAVAAVGLAKLVFFWINSA